MNAVSSTFPGTRRALRASTALPRLSGLAMIALAASLLPRRRGSRAGAGSVARPRREPS
jgi:hypothetical protein